MRAATCHAAAKNLIVGTLVSLSAVAAACGGYHWQRPDRERQHRRCRPAWLAGIVATALTLGVVACGGPGTTTMPFTSTSSRSASTTSEVPVSQRPRTSPRPTSTISPGRPPIVHKQCLAGAWPRPVPQVVGQILDQAYLGALACFEGLRGHDADGHDPVAAGNHTEMYGYRITAVSPPTGAPVSAKDVVTVEVVSVDPTAAPAFQPCNWITQNELAKVLGIQDKDVWPPTPVGDEPGSVDQACRYVAGYQPSTRQVTSELKLAGSFPVDAKTDFDETVQTGAELNPPGTDIAGLPGPAYCTRSHGSGGEFDEFKVLLRGGRIYVTRSAGFANDSCDTLRRLAEIAIPRIGA
jgi:hypothetical protein